MYTLKFKNKLSPENQIIFEEISFLLFPKSRIKQDCIIFNKNPFDKTHEKLLIEFFDECFSEINKNDLSGDEEKINVLFKKYSDHSTLKSKFKFAAWFNFINKIVNTYIANENASISKEEMINYFYEAKLIKNIQENRVAIDDLLAMLYRATVVYDDKRRTKIFYYNRSDLESIKLDPYFFNVLKNKPKLYIIKMMRSLFPTHLVLYPFLGESIDFLNTQATKKFASSVIEKIATKNRPKFQYLHELSNKVDL